MYDEQDLRLLYGLCILGEIRQIRRESELHSVGTRSWRVMYGLYPKIEDGPRDHPYTAISLH